MMTLTHQTRIAISLVIDDEAGQLADFLAVMTALIGLLLTAGRFVSEVYTYICDVVEAVRFTTQVWEIWIKALAFGLGVRG